MTATSALAWGFPSGVRDALSAYGARFDAPFWASFRVDGDTRSVALPDGTVITEKLVEEWNGGYRYHASGVDGITEYEGSFAVNDDGLTTSLTWRTAFETRDTPSATRMLTINATGGQAMLAALTVRFTPQVLTPEPTADEILMPD